MSENAPQRTRQTMADRVVGGRVLDVRMGLPLRWPLGIEPSELGQ